MNRRSFLSGIIAAPAVILTPGLLMPIKAWIPLIVGNGVHDDHEGLTAFLNNQPFKSLAPGFTREVNNLTLGQGTFRSSKILYLSLQNYASLNGHGPLTKLLFDANHACLSVNLKSESTFGGFEISQMPKIGFSKNQI